MKAIIYCRVSTIDQVIEGNSLKSQERLCRNYAKNNNFDIDRVFIEKGESAKTSDRTELKKLMRYCKDNSGKLDVILIYKIDRLSRDSYDYVTLKTYFTSCKVRLISITEPIEDNPLGRFIEHTLSGIAQLDNEIRGERSKNGMLEALKQGRWTFPAPYGYRTYGGKGNSNIEPIPTIAVGLERVFKEINKNFKSIEEIRKLAKSLGLTRKDGSALTKSHFYKIIRNPVYMGWIDVSSIGVYQKGSFKPIVKENVFNQAQDILKNSRKKVPVYKKLNPDFPLRGFLKCGCGKVTTASWVKKNHGYYRCTRCKGVNINKIDIELQFEKYLRKIKFNKKTAEIVKEALLINWEECKHEFSRELARIEKRKTEIKNLENKVVDKNILGVYSDELTKSKLSEYKKEIVELNTESLKYKNPNVLTEELIDYSLKFLMNLSKVWEKLDINQKFMLQKILFPDGIVYLNGNLATPVKSCIIELNDIVSAGKSTMVNQSESFCNQLTNELVDLAKISKTSPSACV